MKYLKSNCILNSYAMENKRSDSGNAKLRCSKFYGQFNYAAVFHCICGPLPYFGINLPTSQPLMSGGNGRTNFSKPAFLAAGLFKYVHFLVITVY